MGTPIEKILVANRGEIAVRVMRASEEMGIKTVAVFSEADRDALHVRLAGEAYLIGPPPAEESYLKVESILGAAKKSGADAIHPGYGFLAENAGFAQAVGEAGITFIGPTPENIRAMGDKIEARKLAGEAGVPVVPGFEVKQGRGIKKKSDAEIIDELKHGAKGIGFPVLIKAVAGGGGKGMRIVKSSGEFLDAAEAAMRESRAAFGSPQIYIEKYLVAPRHVEVQVLGDGKGTAVHVGERECSVQRRHQKIIEESPSPAIVADTRSRMTRAAVSITSAINYIGAGTVEFMYVGGGEFYFLEMNTRLQVEHPVTEMVYGLDLVREQILIAEGNDLPFDEPPPARGHAIESRIYAEDASRGFLPSVGTVEILEVPEGNGVRNDSSLFLGARISEHYDPLLAKLIVWGEDRERALAKMDWALSRYRVLGVTTNIDFLRSVITNPRFASGSYDTHLLDDSGDELIPTPISPSIEMLSAVAIFAETPAARIERKESSDSDIPGPWTSGEWRLLGDKYVQQGN